MGGGILIVEGKGSQYRGEEGKRKRIALRTSETTLRNHMTVYLLQITYVYVYLYKHIG